MDFVIIRLRDQNQEESMTQDNVTIEMTQEASGTSGGRSSLLKIDVRMFRYGCMDRLRM